MECVFSFRPLLQLILTELEKLLYTGNVLMKFLLKTMQISI